MYTTLMRRIQLYVDEDVDEALTAEAARLGTSRSALVRDAVRNALAAYFADIEDPIEEIIGSIVGVDPVDDIDAIVYGLDA